MSTQEPTRSPEDRRLDSARALTPGLESLSLYKMTEEPVNRIHHVEDRTVSFTATTAPEDSSFAMDLVVPCASLAHGPRETLEGLPPTEHDPAIAARDPSLHDVCAWTRPPAWSEPRPSRVNSKHKTSKSIRHARLGYDLFYTGSAQHQLTRRQAMACTPCERSSRTTPINGRPTDVADDALPRRRISAVDDGDVDRIDAGDDAQRSRRRLLEELVELEVERLIGLGVLTRQSDSVASPSLTFIVPKRNGTVRFVIDRRTNNTKSGINTNNNMVYVNGCPCYFTSRKQK